MCNRIGPRQEFVDAAIRMAVEDLADHIDQVGVRIDAVEFAGLDQRSNDRPGNKGSWPDVHDRLNRLLSGWSAYFSHGTRVPAYRAIDAHVYDRVRNFLAGDTM